ncbi:MAG: hypothetical protein OEW99_13365 [Gammaproteobacteria bacterium]|nr:hypothetical protein [Gammaproteobacteria bacterium]MDH5659940.1 hypothetical protein [Gammaproteobacteria bacterium]
MSNLLKEWSPSQAAIDVIKLNGIEDDHITKTVEYLKNETELNNIDDLDGYDNWNSFFIIFCIKAHKNAS